MYTRSEVNDAIEMTTKAINGIAKILANNENFIGANATENAALSYEQILRAALRLNKDEVVERQ